MHIFIESKGKVVGIFEKSHLASAIYIDGRCKLRGLYSREEWDIPMTPNDFAKLVRQLQSNTF